MGFNQPQSIKAGHIAQTLASKYLNGEIGENLQDGHFFFPSLCPAFFSPSFVLFLLISLYEHSWPLIMLGEIP